MKTHNICFLQEIRKYRSHYMATLIARAKKALSEDK